MGESILEISLPMQLQPLERGERFDLPLCDLFDEIGGEIVGSGTMCKNGVVAECVIEIMVPDLDSAIPRVIAILKEGGASEGTTIVLVDSERKQLFRVGEQRNAGDTIP